MCGTLRGWWDRLSGREADRARQDWETSTVRLRAATESLEARTRSMHSPDAAAQAIDRLNAATRNLERLERRHDD